LYLYDDVGKLVLFLVLLKTFVVIAS